MQKCSIIHRDIYQGNLHYTSDNEIVVLDWSVSYISDFRLDLGYTLMQINLDDDRTISRNQFLDLYEKFTSETIENIEFFEILALIKNIMIQTILHNHQSPFNNNSDILDFIRMTKSFILLQKIGKSTYLDLEGSLTSFKK